MMQKNDVELRLPCQEGALGKSSQLALVKIRKSMTKAKRRIKRSCLKAEKEDRGKSRKVFQRGGHSFLLWISEKLYGKTRKVFEGMKKFPYDPGKA